MNVKLMIDSFSRVHGHAKLHNMILQLNTIHEWRTHNRNRHVLPISKAFSLFTDPETRFGEDYPQTPRDGSLSNSNWAPEVRGYSPSASHFLQSITHTIKAPRNGCSQSTTAESGQYDSIHDVRAKSSRHTK